MAGRHDLSLDKNSQIRNKTVVTGFAIGGEALKSSVAALSAPTLMAAAAERDGGGIESFSNGS